MDTKIKIDWNKSFSDQRRWVRDQYARVPRGYGLVYDSPNHLTVYPLAFDSETWAELANGPL